MPVVKRITIEEFRKKGYLQELNRRFLHPLGLALEVIVHKSGKESLGGIWDYREDPEGIYYDLENSEENRLDMFTEKSEFIESEFTKRAEGRIRKLGYFYEPIPKTNQKEKIK